MCLRVALMIASFCAMFVIAQDNQYGVPSICYKVNRALVIQLDYDITSFKLRPPRNIEREKKENSDDGNKPYTYPGGVTYYCCPRTNEQGEKAVPEMDKLDGCLFAIRNEKDSRAYYCQIPIKAMAIPWNSPSPCTVNQRSGLLYKIGYKYCYKMKAGSNKGDYIVDFQTVYNLCYDHEKKQTLYVDYKIDSLKLLRSEEIYEEEKNFTTRPTTFGYGIDNFEEELKHMQNDMEDFPWENEKTKYTYRQKEMLASRLHFPFVQLKRVLFHYSNIILVSESIIQLFHDTQNFFTTISRIDEIRIFAVPVYLPIHKDLWREHAPYLIGYLIFDKEETKGIAIILHNESETMKNKLESQCDTISCPEKYQTQIINKLSDELKQFAYCCNINIIMRKWNFYPLEGKSNFDTLKI